MLNLDADAGVTTSGGVVSGWADRSGSGNHLIGAGDPTLLVGALKGHNVIQLDGSGDKLSRTLTLNGLPDGNKARSMFLVTKYDGGGFGGAAYGDNQSNQSFGTIVTPDGKLMAQGWGVKNDFKSGIAGTGQGWLIQEIVYDGTTVKHYKDGQLIDSQTHSYNTDTTRGKGLVIGAELDSDPYVDMDVAAMLVYDRALSDAERQQVEAHLQNKYFGSVVTPPSNSKPIAVNDTASVEAGKTVAINVLANDSFGKDGPNVGAISINGVTHGTAVVNKAGTPNDPTDDTISFSANAGYVGPATVNYTIADKDGDTSSATVTITVNPVKVSPVPTGPLPTTGLVLNLDADAGVTTSGGVVSGWADQSGSAQPPDRRGRPNSAGRCAQRPQRHSARRQRRQTLLAL